MDAFQIAQYIAQFAYDENIKNELKKFGIGIVPNSLSQLVSKLEGAGYVVMKKEDFENEYVHISLYEQQVASLEAATFEDSPTIQTNQPSNNSYLQWNPNQQQVEPLQEVSAPNFERFGQNLNNQSQQINQEQVVTPQSEQGPVEKKQLIDPFGTGNLLTVEDGNTQVNFKALDVINSEEGLPFSDNKSKDPFAQYEQNTATTVQQETQQPTTTYESQLTKTESTFSHISPETPVKNEVEEMWKTFLEKGVDKEPISFMSLILKAKAKAFENEVLTLEYDPTQTYQMKQIKSQIEKLKELFLQEMGLSINFEFKVQE